MPGASLLTLIDDITAILDDVAVLTKVAAKKTSGVLGDDLALNAQQVAGVSADRELPVVWAVAKGSAVNKLILVPGALVISRFVPWLVTPLLVAGGAYLCFEGVEKITHKMLHAKQNDPAASREGVAVEEGALEKEKIRGAIRTDFVLSAEIVVITLGSVATAAFVTQVFVLSAVAVLMTVGVYGAVAGIVKLDDAGLHLSLKTGTSLWARMQRAVGRAILRAAPALMRLLALVGTAAMFLVGGGILTHGIHLLHALKEGIVAASGTIPAIGGLLGVLTAPLVDVVTGMLVGAVALAVVSAAKAVARKVRGAA